MTSRPRPLLVASDVDGTLIDDRERIPQRVRTMVSRVTRHGTVFALATGRPPRWIHPVLEQLTVRPLCVCANGAIIYDSATDTIVRTYALEPAALTSIAGKARAALADIGGTGFAVERAGTSAFAPEDELFIVCPQFISAWPSDDHGITCEEELFSQPAIKLLIRNPNLTSEQIYHRVLPHIPSELAHLTYSVSDGLVEVAAPGINKATGVQYLAQQIGARADDAVCFGDMPNDIEMLQWAGLGVAMSNAMGQVKSAAHRVTRSNNEGGIADILGEWF